MAAYDLQAHGVFLIGLSDCGEKVTAAGGRVSTQPGTALGIWEKSQDAEKNASLIDKVTRSGHNSVVEHTYYNLAFQNVSAVVEQFIIEFRLASFTVKSRRYVDFSDAGFYVPAFEDPALADRYRAHMASFFNLYTEFTEAGVPKEDARFLLPYCLFSNFFCSVNGRELLHMLRAMLFGRGSRFAEIRGLGEMLLAQVRERTPGILHDFEARSAEMRPDVPDFSALKLPEAQSGGEPVELLRYTPDAAQLVTQTALIEATGCSTAAAAAAAQDKETVRAVLEALIRSSRPRALESAVYTLRFNSVSLSGLTHFTRHRMQSIEVTSLLQTDRARHILPPSVAKDKALLQQYTDAFSKMQREYEALKAAGVPEETLVYYQLSGNTVDIVTTMNARELLLFLRLRTCTRAQWEIRAHAIEALRLLRQASPEIFRYYGPSCFLDRCPEGKFSCGRMQDMHDIFSAL